MHDYCDGVDDRIYKALLSNPGQNFREVWLSLITSFSLSPKISMHPTKTTKLVDYSICSEH